MTRIAEVWRCPVCEGVNRGGRTCATCGETLPEGYTPVDVGRPLPPSASTTAPKVVRPPSAPRTPSPEEIFGSNPFR